MVCANAGAALDCWRDRAVLSDSVGFDEAKDLLLSGKTKATFVKHLTLAKQLSG